MRTPITWIADTAIRLHGQYMLAKQLRGGRYKIRSTMGKVCGSGTIETRLIRVWASPCSIHTAGIAKQLEIYRADGELAIVAPVRQKFPLNKKRAFRGMRIRI